MKLYDRSTGKKETFHPINPENVGVYFCGPTVYDRIHLGNLRSILIGDILNRTLRLLYPKVTFVRNITDVDDKIVSRAKENSESISNLTERTISFFHDDLREMAVIPPDIEPKATDHISDMIDMISDLLRTGYAYESDGHVLFDVTSFPDYGSLSGRSVDDLKAGVRVEVEGYKRNPNDFVLWKPSSESHAWDSPFGRGAPGWHIECSAMAKKYLGESFDIHGGGNDLLFPHHENERAQSICSCKGSHFAKNWLHVGMLLFNGEKMSKSLGNFFTIRQALGRINPEVLRLLYLGTHYRSSLDFTWEKLEETRKLLDKFYRVLTPNMNPVLPVEVIEALEDDLNTPKVITLMHQYVSEPEKLLGTGRALGLFSEDRISNLEINSAEIERLLEKRANARKAKNYSLADQIREELKSKNVHVEDSPAGTTWRVISF